MALFDCTVVVPTIQMRSKMLERAVRSVSGQNLGPTRLVVEFDGYRTGAAATRDRAMAAVTTEWVAFLDDDDEFLPQHLERLHAAAAETDADLVYPWFTVVGGTDPFPHLFGQEFVDGVTQTTVTVLVRSSLVLDCGGFSGEHDPGNEENGLVRRIYASGAKIVHLPERTWLWHHHGGNTSGMPDR